MSREVIEREGIIDWPPAPGPRWHRAHADARLVASRVLELAHTSPPHLVEEPLSVTAHLHLPGADGRRRYFVRAVMNTEKGHRLLVPDGLDPILSLSDGRNP